MAYELVWPGSVTNGGGRPTDPCPEKGGREMGDGSKNKTAAMI